MSTLKGKSISSTYQNLLQTSSEVNNTSLKTVETGSGNSVAMKLSTDKAEFTKVGIGTSGTSPDGLLHVMGVSAGSVTSNVSANQLTLENSTDSGLTILSGASSSGNIFFGDANSNKSGQIYYDHSSDYLGFATGGDEKLRIDKNGNVKISGILSQSEDRYLLEEYFHKLPYNDIQDTEKTQSNNVSTAVVSHTKHVRITTVANDLAANQSQEFQLTNNMIHTKSHVSAVLVNTSATIAAHAMVNVMAHTIADGSCLIRISNGGVDIANMTFTIQVTVDPHIDSNDHWALDGTNSTDIGIRYSGAQPGIEVNTVSGDNDQMIIHPKISNQGNNSNLINVSPWRNVNFHSEYQTELNVAITTDSVITHQAIWAGMKLTTDAAYATDADQAYFLYATDDDLGNLTANGNLHFIYSVGGVDYITNLGIVVEANTVYRLKLSFDENRRISVFVNGVQYGLTSTPTTTTAGGVTQSVNTTKSLVMTSSADLVPVVAIQNLSAALRVLNCSFIKISRTLS